MLHWFARRLKDVQEVPRDERGFTLIELLVVIIIIGILATIAIPVFLAQRDRAQEAAAESDLRNLAAEATAYAANNDGDYTGMTVPVLSADPYNFNGTEGVQTVVDTADADGFMAHSIAENGTRYNFSSDTGRVVEAAPAP